IHLKLFLAGYASERFALWAFSDDMKTIKLRKNKKRQPNETLSFTQCVSEFIANRMNIEMYRAGAYASLKGLDVETSLAKRSSRSTDILDSWLMLPGSFESGKRR